MKFSKIAVSILATVVGICGVGSIPTSANIETKKDNAVYLTSNQTQPHIRYDFLPQDEMPILGYVGVLGANTGSAGVNAQNPSFLTKANMQRYKDAGFNILSGLYEKEPFHTPEIRKAMELCDELGLAYFICDNAFRCDSDYGAAAVMTPDYALDVMKDKWYLNEPSFGGIAVKDEPQYQDFDSMASVSKALKELTDGKVVYTNLFPQYASSTQIGFSGATSSTWEQYEQYARWYIEKVQPDIMAFDYYVFMSKNATLNNTSGSGNIIDQAKHEVNVDGYLKSLSLFRNLSLENNIPYWVTVASYNHRDNNHFTQKQTEWTVNTSLAYGAKGIQYYTYWDSTIVGTTMDDWDSKQPERGLVTLNGTAHDAYYRIQKVNQNIKTVDDVLMKCTHKGVIQYGTQALTMVPEDTLYSFGLLNNITGGDAFVGCFEYIDALGQVKQVYYIVNNSINAGVQTLKADFVDNVNIRLTNLNGSVEYNNVYSAGFNLSGGEAILLEVL